MAGGAEKIGPGCELAGVGGFAGVVGLEAGAEVGGGAGVEGLGVG
jgi:hypothetical protein